MCSEDVRKEFISLMTRKNNDEKLTCEEIKNLETYAALLNSTPHMGHSRQLIHIRTTYLEKLQCQNPMMQKRKKVIEPKQKQIAQQIIYHLILLLLQTTNTKQFNPTTKWWSISSTSDTN